MNAQTAIQLLLMVDAISSKVFGMISAMKAQGAADEEQLRIAIAEHRARNDAQYRSVIANLKSKAK